MNLPGLIFVIFLSVLSQTECILNGVEVKPEHLGNYKYLVSIVYHAKVKPKPDVCGGAILNDRLILTAAHCFAKRDDGEISDHHSIKVRAYSLSTLEGIPEGSLLRLVSKIYVHAGYFQTLYDHDIAIVQLRSSLNLIRNFYKVKAITLPPVNFPTAGEEAVVAGYGVNAFVGTKRVMDSFLRNMSVIVVPDDDLDELYVSGRPTDVSEPRGFCGGDSGSPLVIRSKANFGLSTDYIAIGIVKGNQKDCDDRVTPGRYTRVSSYLDSFINKIMADPDNIVDNDVVIKDVSNVQSCGNN